MKYRHRVFGRAALPAALGFALFSRATAAETIRNHFDTDSMMRAPGFFELVVLGPDPAPARWLVLADQNPVSAPNRLAQVELKRPADSIAAAVRRTYAFEDGSVTTFLRQGGSREGLLLRMADVKNFLVLMVDTASGEAVLSSWRDGKPSELGRGHATFARNWEKFGVVAQGPKLTVTFNDQKIFEATDPHPVSGRTGLVAAGPGEASFDEFVLEFPSKP
jgi:hypothetical protein